MRSKSQDSLIESVDDGVVTKFKGQSAVEEAIFSRIYDDWFYLPEQARVCQGTLRGKFYYQANTVAGRQVLSED